LVIHEKLDRAIEPKHHVKESQVRTLCCIPRGPVRCECWMNKNSYVAGETAQIHVQVDNDSAVNVTSFNSKLIREITLFSHGHVKTLRDVICMQQYPGTPAHSKKATDIPLPLLGKKGHCIQASTNSKLIQCKYLVMVEMSVPWAPDLEIYSPVILYQPQSSSWANWSPPNWLNQAVPQVVCNQLAVSSEILASRMQGGYFQPPQISLNLLQPPQIQIQMKQEQQQQPLVSLEFNVKETSPLLGQL